MGLVPVLWFKFDCGYGHMYGFSFPRSVNVYILRRVWRTTQKLIPSGIILRSTYNFTLPSSIYCAFWILYLSVCVRRLEVFYFASKGYINTRRHRDMVYQYAQFAECNDCHNFIMSFNINNLEWSQICTKPNRSHELCHTKFMDPKTAAPPNFETFDDGGWGGWKAGVCCQSLLRNILLVPPPTTLSVENANEFCSPVGNLLSIHKHYMYTTKSEL